MSQQDELRGVVRAWLDHLQSKYAVTPRAIAMRAGLAPSTIYRWLDENAPFVMSLPKLQQVAAAFGEPLPEGLAGGSAPAHARPAGFSESDVVPYVGELPGLPSRLGVNQGRWRVTSEALNLEGFRPGDVLEFDLGLAPRAGDVVVAQVYNLQRGTADTVLRLFRPPFLITRSTDARVDAQPQYVDGERVLIMGTFVRMVRERAA